MLVHWWPFTSNGNDYGTSAINLSEVSLTTAGKIGAKCFYNSTKTLTAAQLADLQPSHSQSISFAMWIKGDSGRTYTMAANAFEMRITPGGTNGFRLGNGGTNTYAAYATSGAVPVDTWTHIAGVWDADRKEVRYYVNGGTPVITGNLGSIAFNTIGNMAIPYQAGWYIQDYRIYNHALSNAEVAELAKGLVVHYTFEDEYLEGTTNLKPWLSTSSTGSVGWDTSLNGPSPAPYKTGWTTGYNGGVSNPSTGYHANWVMIDGELVMRFPNLNSIIGSKGRWLGHSGSVNATGTVIPAGTKYTISWDQYSVEGNTSINLGLYYKVTASATSNTFKDGTYTAVSTVAGQWVRMSHTFTRDAGFDSNTNTQYIYVYGHYGNEGTTYVKNIQIEVKDHATPFTADSRATGKVYDSSGYNNDATLIGDCQLLNESNNGNHSLLNNSDGTNNSSATGAAYIKGVLSGAYSPDKMTVSFWANVVSYGYQTSGILSLSNSSTTPTDYNNASGIHHYDSNFRFAMATTSKSLSTNVIEVGNWHHYVLVYDGANVISYRDGAVSQTVSGAEGNIKPFQYIYLGLDCAGGAYRKSKIKWADFKIYGTALSAADVLAEYNCKAFIDRPGNLFTGQFISESSNITIANRKDQVIATHFQEGTSNVELYDRYTALEYIQSTGTQWIDSNISIAAKTSVESKIQWTDISGSYPMLYGAWSVFSLSSMPSGKLCIASGTKTANPWTAGPTVSANIIYWMIHQPDKLVINGLVYTIPSASTSNAASDRHILVFAASNSGNTPYNWSTYCKCKLYDLKILNDGTLIRHFIPAKRNSDNVIGLYDLVNHQFYTNSGTGSFTAGPELGPLTAISANKLYEI